MQEQQWQFGVSASTTPDGVKELARALGDPVGFEDKLLNALRYNGPRSNATASVDGAAVHSLLVLCNRHDIMMVPKLTVEQRAVVHFRQRAQRSRSPMMA